MCQPRAVRMVKEFQDPAGISFIEIRGREIHVHGGAGSERDPGGTVRIPTLLGVETDIEIGRGMGQRSDGNHINPGFGDAANRIKIDPA